LDISVRNNVVGLQEISQQRPGNAGSGYMNWKALQKDERYLEARKSGVRGASVTAGRRIGTG
jgi:hypothetical protein